MARKFQIIVSTDAGNEGIDLQSARCSSITTSHGPLSGWSSGWAVSTG